MTALKNKGNLLLILFIILLGFFLRFYNLGTQSLWYDELRTAQRIDHSFIQTIKSLFNSPFPPLYYMFMNIWVNFFGNSELSLRFPSLIFSTLSIIFIFKLSKRLFNEKVGIISSLLLSISPYSINYAQEAKMYALLWFFGILSFLFFYIFISEDNSHSLILYVIFTTLAIYTMYIGFIFIFIQNILFFSFNRKRWKKWLFAQAIIFLLYVPWMNQCLLAAYHRTGIDWISKTSNYYKFFIEMFMLITGISIGKKDIALFYIYLFLIISAIISAIFSGKHKNKLNYSLIFMWILIPFIVYYAIDTLFFPILEIRYLGFLHIPFIILFSHGLDKCNNKIKIVILIFLICMISMDHLYPYYKDNLKISKEDWKAIAIELHKKVGYNDIVVSALPMPVIEYYYRDKNIIPDITYLNKIQKENKYDSIFIIYRGVKPKINAPDAYKLKEHYSIETIGFLRFTK